MVRFSFRCGQMVPLGLVALAMASILWLSEIVPGPFWRAWAATGALPNRFYYTSWGVWNHHFSSVGALEKEANSAALALGRTPGATPDVTVGGLFRQVRLVPAGPPTGSGDGVTVVAQTLNQRLGLGEKPVTYLVIDVKSASLSGIKKEIRRIQTAYRRFRIRPWDDVSATGTIRGKLTPARYRTLRRRVLAVLAARPLESVGGNISALSPVLQSSITVAGKAINLQMAVTFDPRRDLTRVSLGTPVLATY